MKAIDFNWLSKRVLQVKLLRQIRENLLFFAACNRKNLVNRQSVLKDIKTKRG